MGNLENDDVEAWDCPITIEYLNFGPCGCWDCGIICEIPEFGGEILINDKKYKYEGSIGSKRWCEHNDFKPNTRMSDKEILHRLKKPDIFFKIYVDNCPNIMFFRNSTTVNEFHLK